MNFIICLAITIFLLWLLRAYLKPRIGAMFPYSNVPYILIFIIACFLLVFSVKKGALTIDYIAVTLGAILFVVGSALYHFMHTKNCLNAEGEYKQKHQWQIENIDTDKLKDLLIECRNENIDVAKRFCDCRCKFNDTCLSDKCLTLDNSGKVTPENCMPFSGCGNAYCSVFRTIVEHKSDYIWDVQDKKENNEFELEMDCLCLLSKIDSNEALRQLVNEIAKII